MVFSPDNFRSLLVRGLNANHYAWLPHTMCKWWRARGYFKLPWDRMAGTWRVFLLSLSLSYHEGDNSEILIQGEVKEWVDPKWPWRHKGSDNLCKTQVLFINCKLFYYSIVTSTKLKLDKRCHFTHDLSMNGIWWRV